ncbi:MAG: N,N-diacetylchitobiose transport system permease protein [Cryptosporangiaceae bacterium]|jgi:N,N'-diacetylchitobiose transport system permease protein|nr:N,N-diacetylchitobiose transport system permease protein [Cryptosporangiaceae bacterium]
MTTYAGPGTASGATSASRRSAKAPARAARRRSSARAGRRSTRILLNLAAIAAFIFATFPVYWMVKTSLVPTTSILGDGSSGAPQVLPFPLTFEHYARQFQGSAGQQPLSDALYRSLFVALASVLLSMVVAFLAAIAIARFRFTGRAVYLIALMGIQMIPLEAMVIPIYTTLRDANALDSLWSLVALYLVFVIPFTIWTLRSFIAGIPVDLEEAAMIDGCTRFQAFWKVLFPLIAPGLVATSIYAFIQAWNEYIFCLTIMNTGHGTLPVWLGQFTGKEGTDWGAVMAGSTLFTIPVVILFILIQKKITTGMAAGAVKG